MLSFYLAFIAISEVAAQLETEESNMKMIILNVLKAISGCGMFVTSCIQLYFLRKAISQVEPRFMNLFNNPNYS